MQSLEASEKWQLHRVVALWFLFLLLLACCLSLYYSACCLLLLVANAYGVSLIMCALHTYNQ